MSEPRKVYIGPFTYNVRVVPGLADSGSCHTTSEVILLAEEQTLRARQDTLVHESLHAVVAQGLKQPFEDVSKEFEETVVSQLAPRVLAWIRDNPGMVEFLQE